MPWERSSVEGGAGDNWLLLWNRRRGFQLERERITCIPRKLTRVHNVMACQAFCHNTSPGKSHTAQRSWAWLVHSESVLMERRLPSARQWQRHREMEMFVSEPRQGDRALGLVCLLSCPFPGNELIRSAAWMALSQNTDICLCGTTGQCLWSCLAEEFVCWG